MSGDSKLTRVREIAARALEREHKKEALVHIFDDHARVGESVNNHVIICPRVGYVYKFYPARTSFCNEAYTYKALRNQLHYSGIVRGVCYSRRAHCVRYEYMPLGPLNTVLGVGVDEACPPMERRCAWDIFYQVASILYWLHRRDIVHLDVKPSNIYVRSRQTSDGLMDVALGDFDHSYVAKYKRDTALPFGSDLYAPPEAKTRAKGVRTPAADVFALGATLHELLTGCDFPLGRRHLHRDDLALIDACTARERHQRITVDALVHDPRALQHLTRPRLQYILNRLGDGRKK
jgi:serine/threonine protein kinase